jgi:hypothetical protein
MNMAKDHGPTIKDDDKYEALRRKGMSKTRAAKITNAGKEGSRKGGKKSGGRKKKSGSRKKAGGRRKTGGTKAGRKKGGRRSSSKK